MCARLWHPWDADASAGRSWHGRPALSGKERAMLVIASTNGRVGIKEAVEVLRRGGSALDAVEAGIRPVERNPDDHSVGLGGLPNLLGQVELDASIMDGHTRAAGAVGALRGYVHAITLAR